MESTQQYILIFVVTVVASLPHSWGDVRNVSDSCTNCSGNAKAEGFTTDSSNGGGGVGGGGGGGESE